MEKHKPSINKIGFEPTGEESAIEYFTKAYQFTHHNYPESISEISSKNIDTLTKGEFLKEFIWVVHATGFSASAVGKFMDRLLVAYGEAEILAAKSLQEAESDVRPIVNNPQKIKAVHKCAQLLESLESHSWEVLKKGWKHDVSSLAELPYIGHVTKYHLGRNIGLKDLVKPDLHLVRMQSHWNFSSVLEMCKTMRDSKSSYQTLDLGIVDLCLWYYASTFGTMYMKSGEVR